jgi:hypothetical protein
MPSLMPDQVDDFVNSVIHKYERMRWEDISLPLQEYYFASRIFDRAKAEEMSGDLLEFKLQYQNPGNAMVIGLYQVDSSNRVDLLTKAQVFWSITSVNYNYDVLEAIFRKGPEEIIDYLMTQEHAMYNDYFVMMESLMFGAGPSGPNVTPRPPASILWWIQAYNTAANQNNSSTAYQLSSGQTSGFWGMNPPNMGGQAGWPDAQVYPGWRNRIGQYTVFTQNDAVNTIVECLDRCKFTPAHSYAELSSSEKPNWELLTTYSRVKAARDLAQAGNDNIGSELAKWKDKVMIRGVPLTTIWAWTSPESPAAQTNGPIVGVNWKTFHYMFASGLRQVKRKPFQHPTMSNVRIRKMDDSGQLYCNNRRANFNVTCTATVTEQD